uniref:Uncharacterized protein n=1 Tax=Sphaerodactylus townsendi TaxID=933632 RepID=A0ACB8EC16_9SAUR
MRAVGSSHSGLEVILKDLEVLAEIASSPAGQTEDQGPCDGSETHPGQLELRVPPPTKTGQAGSPAVCDEFYQPEANGFWHKSTVISGEQTEHGGILSSLCSDSQPHKQSKSLCYRNVRDGLKSGLCIKQ